SWSRDNHEQVRGRSDALGRITRYTYDYDSGLGDLVQVIYSDGKTNNFKYDATFHKVTQSQDALGNWTVYTYDPVTGDLLTIRDPLNNLTTQAWSDGLLQSVTDPLGHTITYQYNYDSRQLLQTVDALGGITYYGYDAAGNQTTVTDPLGHTTMRL